MNTFSPDVNERPRQRYCILAYSPSHGTEGVSPRDQAVLLFLEQLPCLLVLVAPDWKNRVLPPDQDYFEELIADFAHRAKLDPLSLFEQVSELNFGPIVTRKTGYAEDEADIAEFIQRFIPV